MNRHPDQPIDHVAARRLIDAYLVDQLAEADAARLADHLRECPACAAELGGSTRLISLLGGLQTPPPTPDLDERIILAAIADRRSRHERRSWLADLRVQILRGAMRTTGTLVATIIMVALLSVSFAFAASFVVVQTVDFIQAPRATVTPTVTPTHTPTVAPTTAPVATETPGQPSPTVRPATPEPTPRPTAAPTATAEPTPEATPSPTPTATAEPTPEPTPSATVEPTATPTPTEEPSPTPSPTEKPKRTPTPPPSAVSDGTSPTATSTPLP